MTPRFEIFYILALPDWAPDEVTPFQGFARRLPYFVPLMERIPTMPADIIEPTLDLELRLARRRGGEGAWLWTPVNLSTLLGKRKPLPTAPYFVVMSADEQTARKISKWRQSLRLQPLHLSFHRVGGALNPLTFTRDNLRHHLIALAKKAAAIERHLDVGEHLRFLAEWQPEDRRPSTLTLHSHNATRANEMTLIGAGEAAPTDEAGHLNVSEHQAYVVGITESTEAVMGLWEQTGDRLAYMAAPPRPDIFLVAPAMFRGMPKRLEQLIEDPALKMALRRLDRQREFTMQLTLNDDSEIEKIGPLLSLRGAEMKLLTTAVGLRAAGTLAATIRLPPAVDRAGGVIGQLARFLRSHEDPPPIKAARVFKAVQQALEDAIPREHRALIERSTAGVKIVGDAPLEWLPIKGVPLGIRFDVSRINSTPGNLFLEQIRQPDTLHIAPDAFRDYLVLSMFDEGDPIAPHLRVATLMTMDGDGENIIGRYTSPRSPAEFVAAINAFKGPMLIVDSHAEHGDETKAGGLLIGGKSFDVWSLTGKVRMPPIVILSACDTHPFDRSHATVANGFLACGALAVVGTALPIRAREASRFVMRMINRAVHFGSIMNDRGYAVPWTHIVGGVLRMELVTDVIRAFERLNFFGAEQGSDLMLSTHLDLNPLRPDWFERLRERLMEIDGISQAVLDQRVPDVIASSDAIRYLHLGNPEAILVAGPKVYQTMGTLGVEIEAALDSQSV